MRDHIVGEENGDEKVLYKDCKSSEKDYDPVFDTGIYRGNPERICRG